MMELVRATDPDHVMPDRPGGMNPKLAIVREVDFRVVPDPDDDGDMLDFYYSGYTNDVALTSSFTIQDLLRTVARPGFKFPYGESFPDDPFDNNLSLNSKLQTAYIVLKLAKKGWMYSFSQPPFKIGGRGAGAGAYFEAKRITDNLAYFISDGATLSNSGDYVHPFNIYLELFLPKGGPVPIRVDPDVRHPGGSGE